MDLQTHGGQEASEVPVAANAGQEVAIGIPGEEISAGEGPHLARRRAERRGTSIGATHDVLGRSRVPAALDPDFVKGDVGKSHEQVVRRRGDGRAGDRSTGSRVLEGPVLGEAGQNGFGIVIIPARKVSVDQVHARSLVTKSTPSYPSTSASMMPLDHEGRRRQDHGGTKALLSQLLTARHCRIPNR
jgi:hypothetical protein